MQDLPDAVTVFLEIGEQSMEKCIFESSLKNTETEQGGLHGEASIGSTETAMVSDDHYSETKWAEHKKLVCRVFSFIIMHAA